MKGALTRIVSWSHELLAEVLHAGDTVLDLTAGTGQDTLALFRMVGREGQVIAFDIQSQALESTWTRLLAQGAEVRYDPCSNEPLEFRTGIDLICAGHEKLGHFITRPVRGVIANLGYLPGGDQAIITRPETTVVALKKACDLLLPGGRLAVAVYPGHLGGDEEADAVSHFFAGLPDNLFEVVTLRIFNREAAPFLFVGERVGTEEQL